jgi:hypothetical protein
MLYNNANAGPTCCRENNDGNLSGSKVLLVSKIGVGGNKNLEALLLCGTQQLAVFQSSPAKFISGKDTVPRESLP